MARLFIANCTRFQQRVSYRLDFVPEGSPLDPRAARRMLPRHVDIPAGQQRPVGGDLDISQIDEIVDQLKRVGLVGVVDLGRLPKIVCPYVFDIDKPVALKAIRTVLEHNKKIKTDEGHERRRTMAITVGDISQGGDFQVSVEQETSDETNPDRLEEGWRHDAAAVSQRGGRRGRATA